MKGLVIRQNDISDSHTCSYAFTRENSSCRQGVTDFGVLSKSNRNIECEVEGGSVIREALKKTLNKESEEFVIYNLTDFVPQLEISRLPHDTREEAYKTKEYRVEDVPSNRHASTGDFLARAAVDFISTNYSRFDNLVTTDRPPRPIESSDNCDNPSFFVYTDASYHPENNTAGVSIVVIGENGGMYSFAREVNPQAISRAELLAFNLGVRTVREIKQDSNIIAYTDCKNVSRALKGDFLIDEELQRESEEYMDSSTRIDVNCISREANQFADAMAKVGRSRGSIRIGKLKY